MFDVPCFMPMANVQIYTTPTCAYCKMAKEYFKSKNIEYDEFNVAEDEAKRQEMIEKTGSLAVPVIVANNTVIVGFNKDKINEALGIN